MRVSTPEGFVSSHRNPDALAARALRDVDDCRELARRRGDDGKAKAGLAGGWIAAAPKALEHPQAVVDRNTRANVDDDGLPSRLNSKRSMDHALAVSNAA